MGLFFPVLLYLRRPHQFHLLGERRLRLCSLLSRELRGVNVHFEGSAFLKGAERGKIGERLIKGEKCKFRNERMIKH